MASVGSRFEGSTRSIETMLCFAVPMLVLRPLFPTLSVVLGLVLPVFYYWVTIGKPDGYLLHKLYEWGVPWPGLLPPRLKRLRK